MRLKRLNSWLEKLMPIMIPVSLVVGIVFSNQLIAFRSMIPWVFAIMTFSGSLHLNFQAFRQTMAHPKPIFFVLMIAHIVMPSIAWCISSLFFPGDYYTLTGFIVAMTIPTGVTSFIWTTIKNGDASLSLATILTSSLLAPIILPTTVLLFVGATIEMDIANVMLGLVYMVVMPSLLAVFLHELTKGKIVQTVGRVLAPFSKISIAIIVLLNGAVVAPFIGEVGLKLLPIAITALLLALVGYTMAYVLAKWLKLHVTQRISFTYTVGMRNIAAGATLAMTYFPPQVVIPIVSGMLFQQVVAALVGKLLFSSTSKG